MSTAVQTCVAGKAHAAEWFPEPLHEKAFFPFLVNGSIRLHSIIARKSKEMKTSLPQSDLIATKALLLSRGRGYVTIGLQERRHPLGLL